MAASAALDGSEATLEQLLEASFDAILVVDGVGRIHLANGRAEALFGSSERLTGHRIEELIPDPLPPVSSEEILRVGARRLDGRSIQLDIRLSPIGAPAGGAVQVTCRPARGEDDDLPFGRLLHAVPDAVMALDADGIIRFVNRRCETQFGYSYAELVGQSLNILVPDRSKAAFSGSVRTEFFARQPAGANLELIARCKDGIDLPVEVSSSVVTHGKVFVLISLRDISGRRRLEAEREAVEAMLLAGEREVERADFDLQLHEAQRLESIGRLAGGVAHDFNNLLGVIKMYASFVSDRLGSGEAPITLADGDIVQMQNDVQAVQDVAGRASALTHKLLTFGQREVVSPQVLDLNEVVTSMEDLLGRAIGENVDHLCTELADGPLLVKVDRGQIDRVIMNLAVNARDAMPGGGTLEVTTSVVTIDARPPQPLSPGRYAQLSVSDSGVGMTREVAARAFDPFFTTKNRNAGSGFGLATVYGIVKQANGDVSIVSTPGTGTVVNILLPLTEELPRVPAGRSERPPRVDGTETVLLVEDQMLVQAAAARILGSRGYHVLATSNTTDARERARNHTGPIHLLLANLVMPGPSGQELAAAVAQLRPEIRVLFTSGYGWDVFDRQGPGGDATLLDKPFTADELLHAVRLALEAT